MPQVNGKEVPYAELIDAEWECCRESTLCNKSDPVDVEEFRTVFMAGAEAAIFHMATLMVEANKAAQAAQAPISEIIQVFEMNTKAEG